MSSTTSFRPVADSGAAGETDVVSAYWNGLDDDGRSPSLAEQLDADTQLSRVDLIEIVAHSAATMAAAQYRMLQAISVIREEHEEEYGCEVAAAGADESTVAEIAEASSVAWSGGNPRAQFGPDGLDRTVADVGAVLSISPAAARELIAAGEAVRYRLPETGAMVAQGRIDLSRFRIAVARTALCEPESLTEIDIRLAREIGSRDHMSTQRFTSLVDTIVARVDADALRRRKARARAGRNVRIRPDRFTPGAARLSAQLDQLDGARMDARLSAMAAAVHPGDPRTTAQRRADALLALAQGNDRLVCACPACAAPIHPGDTPADDTPADDTPADADAGCSCSCAEHRHSSSGAGAFVSGTVFVVANESTLDGADDDPGYLDGVGVVDADTVREIAAAEFSRRVGVSRELAVQGLDGWAYRPGKRMQAFVRAGEICCTWPGCNSPVWTTDLDHTVPFDHAQPTRGGPTCDWNLKPLCRFHHRIKTFGRWRDYQDTLVGAILQSPTGHWFVGNAFRGVDMFPGLAAVRPKPADHPARISIDAEYAAARAAADRAADREELAYPPPF